MNIELQGKQKDVLSLKPKGHIVVLGAAGSGKTTLAVYRAKFLSNFDPQEKILFLTFNKSLISYMNSAYSKLPRNVTIENYHKFARGYLRSLGLMPNYGGILKDDETKKELIGEVLLSESRKYKEISTFQRPIEDFASEIKFIQMFGISSFEEYEDIERIGRALTNIKRENRKYFYRIFMKYKELREKKGYGYDWDDLAYYVYNEAKKDVRKKLYKHIIVDEGQDFSPIMLKSLIALLAEDSNFVFFGDIAQQIYGSRLSWRNSGIKISENGIWKLENNYRNTAEIVKFALDLTKSKFWKIKKDDLEDLVFSTPPKAEGPRPVLVKFNNYIDEKRWLLKALKEYSTNINVVAVRSREDVKIFEEYFINEGMDVQVLHGQMNSYDVKKSISIGTYHSVKGIEFDNVFLPFFNSENFPNKEILKSAPNEEEAMADELKLFYVAVTRAKQNLIITYNGELSGLFPRDSRNYDDR